MNINFIIFFKTDTINIIINIILFNFYLEIGVRNDTFISKFSI
jgi:hypothetical protein